METTLTNIIVKTIFQPFPSVKSVVRLSYTKSLDVSDSPKQQALALP